MENTEINVPLGLLTEHQVREGARKYIGSRPISDLDFLRVQVNFLRHACSSYDVLRRCTKSSERKAEIKRAVLVQIAVRYPWLAQECGRQLEELRRAIAERGYHTLTL